MKSYGLQDLDYRIDSLDYPDKGDMYNMTLKPARVNIQRKCGKYHGCLRNADTANIVRRTWKKRRRNLTKKEIRKEVSQYFNPIRSKYSEEDLSIVELNLKLRD